MTDLIYFDHAATSWPKPPETRAGVDRYFDTAGGNPGRSGHRLSIAAARVVEEARDKVAELIGAPDPGRISFGKNATEALNVGIFGLLSPGDHAVTSSIEHNSVMRPLRHLETKGLRLTVVPCGPEGLIDPEEIAAAVRPETRLIVTLHGSNVTGALLPIDRIAAIARDHGVPYLVDASQTAGALPIDVEAAGIDLLAFTGHKAMLGPTGTGGLWVRPGIEPAPLMRGGTGSKSDLEVQPDFMPDVHESGTLNVAGLAGLVGGVSHVLDAGVDAIAAHDRALTTRFVDAASEIPGVIVFAPSEPEWRCGVVSFNVEGLASSDVGMLLDRDFGIMSRVGLHCAPGAHRTIGTFPTGTVRFGFGYSNTPDEVDSSIEAISSIAAWAAERRVRHA